jgi:hypothetical protein
MSSAQKKVVIRTFGAVLTWGYLPQGGFRVAGGVSLMAVDGRVNPQSMNEIKTICYVRDFNLDDRLNPERLGRKTFPARPRGDGLWLKVAFVDGDVLEGLANFDIGFADSLLEDGGIFLTPPDSRGNTQRVFVPRTALRAIEVLGYVTAPSKRNTAKSDVAVMADAQAKLFSE